VSRARAWFAAALGVLAGMLSGSFSDAPALMGCGIAALVVTMCFLLRGGTVDEQGRGGESAPNGHLSDGDAGQQARRERTDDAGVHPGK
jgi:hypothetical protein